MKINHFSAIIFILLLLDSIQSNAQYSIGFIFSSIQYSDGHGYTESGNQTSFGIPTGASGIGIFGNYVIKPRIRVGLGLDVAGTGKLQSTYSANNLAVPSENWVVNVSNSASYLRADFNYAFTHNFIDNGFTFYGIAGLVLNGYTYTTDYSETYSQNGITGTISFANSKQNRFYSNASLSLGLGIEYNFSYHTHLFLELKENTGNQTNFNSYNISGEGYYLPENFNPAYASLSLGMRFTLGQKR